MKNTIELKKAVLTDEYSKKWNNHQSDFVNLYLNGKKVNDTLYRVGVFTVKLSEPYFMLIKHVEAYYSDTICKTKKEKRHLEGQWCIINNDGVEKVNFDSFVSPYLQGGQVYSLNSKYYNIETGKLYCYSYTSMSTKHYLFLQNEFDDGKTKRGVLQINKLDGTFTLIQ